LEYDYLNAEEGTRRTRLQKRGETFPYTYSMSDYSYAMVDGNMQRVESKRMLPPATYEFLRSTQVDKSFIQLKKERQVLLWNHTYWWVHRYNH